MIDYGVLVQTIAEWKSGQRPSTSGVYAQAHAEAAPEEVEEVASGLVEMDDESAVTYEDASQTPAEQSGYEDEGEVTYGDEDAQYEAADDDLVVETDDDDEQQY